MLGSSGTDSFWEREVYSKGLQVNRWPYQEVVSTFKRLEAGLPRTRLRILEVGCGTGNNLWFFAAEGHEVHGLDISPSALTLARRHLVSHGFQPELAISDLTTLPFADAAFDLTLERACLSCIASSQQPQTIAELHRVLKPGGVHLSFSLYGMSHPDKHAGEEIEPGTFARFKSGRLARSGQVTFFDDDRIRRLFASFQSVSTKRTCVFEGPALLSEEYSVVAQK